MLPPKEKALWAALSLEHPLLLWAQDGTPQAGNWLWSLWLFLLFHVRQSFTP